MKTLKIISTLTILFLISLSFLMLTTPNPLDQKYDSLIQKLIDKEGVISEKELVNKYEKLARIKNLIFKIKKEQVRIREIMCHPIPPNEQESQVLKQKINSVKLWLGEVQFEMKTWEERMENIMAEL